MTSFLEGMGIKAQLVEYIKIDTFSGDCNHCVNNQQQTRPLLGMTMEALICKQWTIH